MSTLTTDRPAAMHGSAILHGPRLRLTRRGRLALLVAVLCALLLATVAVGSSVLATSSEGAPVEVDGITVQPGQTLWDIAAATGAEGDLRDTVYDIEQLNHLDGAELSIGQRLDVPVVD